MVPGASDIVQKSNNHIESALFVFCLIWVQNCRLNEVA